MHNAYAGRRYTPLIYATLTGNAAMARALLDAGADVHCPDVGGMRPIHHAACLSDAEVLRLLVDRGGDVHCTDSQQRTPLVSCLAPSELRRIQSLMDAMWTRARLMHV
jgi:ankyrin repeat protein